MLAKNNLRTYLTTLIIFVIIDALWLSVISGKLYANTIGHLLGEVNFIAVIIFYIVYSFGLSYLIISPGLKNTNQKETLLRAVLFGFVTYATYDLTNLATLRGWPLNVTIIDLIWGSFLSFATTFLVVKLQTKNGNK